MTADCAPYWIIGIGFVAVFAICFFQARAKGVSMLDRLEGWQTALSALAAAAAVIVTWTFQAKEQVASDAGRDKSVIRALSADILLTYPQVVDVKRHVASIQGALSKNDENGCELLLEESRGYLVQSLGTLNDVRSNLRMVSNTPLVRATFQFYLKIQELNEKTRLLYESDCHNQALPQRLRRMNANIADITNAYKNFDDEFRYLNRKKKG